MEEILDTYTFKPRGKPSLLGSAKWDELLDGKIRRLVLGEDLPYVNLASFRSSASREASKRGLKSTTTVEDDKTVVIQATPKA